MSDAVTADIEIKAPPEKVWKLVMNADRLGDWVTIHRRMDSADAGPPRAGMRMKQTLCLRGASFKVKWELTRCDDARHAVWEGSGPVGSHARTEYELSPDGDGGTRFHYVNEFKAPGGPLGKAASRVIVGGLPQREATKSLQRLKALAEEK
ncbi:MAG: SRPBCC family protein [Solirubrobacteraceae bacterium]